MTQNNECNRNGGNANQGGSDIGEAIGTIGGGAAGAAVGSFWTTWLCCRGPCWRYTW
ncbi:hypothetical protein [Neobacillus sp. 3P2-tot-E-2]|uniref:hypothetical protein n=1 Tax=Neobacillus sp. 3P2-tot-E-2 TaxID=3132212 RepID=UPI0039A03F6C